MHNNRKVAAAGTVLALATATIQSAAADQRTAAAPPMDATHSVTLLTGDQITVHGTRPEQSTLSVHPAPGREHQGFPSYVGNTVEQTVIRAYKLR